MGEGLLTWLNRCNGQSEGAKHCWEKGEKAGYSLETCGGLENVDFSGLVGAWSEELATAM